MKMRAWTMWMVAAVLALTMPVLLAAQGRDSGRIKPIPPPGNALPPAQRVELEAAAAKLGARIEALRKELVDRPKLAALLADVEIYHKAVSWPLRYGEMIDPAAARLALAEGADRAAQLGAGEAKWVNQTGVRAYVSKIDGSIQPYLLFVPASYRPGDGAAKHRFDFWCHGRSEDLMELKFIRSRPEPAAGNDHFLVSLYGRYCNANKFAGEIDCLEALEDVKRRYPVDENRLVNIGFSMGGAATWQFAVHYSDLWAATSPGAGFAESREFLRMGRDEVDAMMPWQRSLWHLYDCTDWAANLAMTPTLAYAGELDGQKQASDIMMQAMKEQGLELERYLGPGTKHQYHKQTRARIDQRLAEICARGREPVPQTVRFTTWTLRYNRMFWVSVEGLGRHWQRATVEASITDPASILIRTSNVTQLRLDVPAGGGKLAPGGEVAVTIDGSHQRVRSGADGGLRASFSRAAGGWRRADRVVAEANVKLREPDFPPAKRHGLCGPIDDAFMDAFLIVEPTGHSPNQAVDAWARSEFAHAVDHWRKQFRGEPRVRPDNQLTREDVARYNLICFGDPASNRCIGRTIEKLPMRWSDDALAIGGQSYDPAHHVPALIYPNPLNPSRYIVLNSGFTFREFDYLNNARQTPKLADWAVIDVSEPVTPQAPGRIVAGGFFGEDWKLAR